MSRIELDAARAALFLDLDGTLAPIVADPRMVGPDARRNDVLAQAERALGGRVAVVSGRAISDVDRILHGRIHSVAGLHGLERRIGDGGIARDPPPPGFAAAAEAAHAFVAAREGLMLEDKGLSLAIHYRAAPAREAEAHAFADAAAARHGLSVQHGKMVVELRTPGADKGDAIAAFMREAPFAGARPIFVGDDLTDEHGFETAAALGGFGVLVGPARKTHASGALAHPEDVLAWIEASLAAGRFSVEALQWAD